MHPAAADAASEFPPHHSSSPDSPEPPTPDDRPRDEQGRALSDRPRDELGRPLPHGAVGVPRQPEGILRSPAETLALGQELLDARKPFHAHDVFEDQWKQTPGAEADLWRALAQLAVGVTHAARGNIRGAAAVLSRAAANLAPYADQPPHGIAVGPLVQWAQAAADRLDPESAEPVWLDAPRLASA